VHYFYNLLLLGGNNKMIEPGIYQGMSNQNYQDADAISNSQIKAALYNTNEWKSQYVDGKDRPDPNLIHFRQGDLVHCLTLDPETFQARFIVDPSGQKTPKAALVKQAVSQGMYCVTAEEYSDCKAMSQAILEHPASAPFFRDYDGYNELSLFTYDPISGQRIKCRIDRLMKGEGIWYLLDVKTAFDASYSGFQKAAVKLGYHIQAAFYRYIARLLYPGVEIDDFVFVVVEKKAPWRVAVYPLAHEDIELGEKLFRAGLEKIEYCLTNDVYPGYNEDKARTLQLPRYAYTEAEGLIGTFNF
jgi:hypothetical protein